MLLKNLFLLLLKALKLCFDEHEVKIFSLSANSKKLYNPVTTTIAFTIITLKLLDMHNIAFKLNSPLWWRKVILPLILIQHPSADWISYYCSISPTKLKKLLNGKRFGPNARVKVYVSRWKYTKWRVKRLCNLQKSLALKVTDSSNDPHIHADV